MLPDTVHQIYGHVSPAEMELLYQLASEVPKDGVIVEIGSFQGKSTVCLGLGAKQAGAWVYAIDPHEDYQESEITHYGMENHAALLKNLVDFQVANTVRVIARPSMSQFHSWWGIIDLLWIDGSHAYEDVNNDLNLWSQFVKNGKIALHDSSGSFPDVSRALDEFLISGKWQITQQVDATTILERVL